MGEGLEELDCFRMCVDYWSVIVPKASYASFDLKCCSQVNVIRKWEADELIALSILIFSI